MAKRIFNLRKDAFDARDHLAAPSTQPLPSMVTYFPWLGVVKNQGNAGSCTGNAGGGWLSTLYNAFSQYFPQANLTRPEFSALFLYAEERIQDGSFPDDNGSDSRTLMQVLQRLGACQESQDPYMDTDIRETPTDAMLQLALPFRIGAYHRVLFDDGVRTSKSVLASGYCHVIGIPVYPALESDAVAEFGLLPVPGPNETPIGGHELLVYGYDDSIRIGSSVGAHLVRNSWGADWGKNGNLCIPYDYYAAVGGNDTADAWVGHMGKPWVPQQ